MNVCRCFLVVVSAILVNIIRYEPFIINPAHTLTSTSRVPGRSVSIWLSVWLNSTQSRAWKGVWSRGRSPLRWMIHSIRYIRLVLLLHWCLSCQLWCSVTIRFMTKWSCYTHVSSRRNFPELATAWLFHYLSIIHRQWRILGLELRLSGTPTMML